MGASKVLIFTYNISSSAAKMIKHYEDIGFLEVLPFDFPEKGRPNNAVQRPANLVFKVTFIFDIAPTSDFPYFHCRVKLMT